MSDDPVILIVGNPSAETLMRGLIERAAVECGPVTGPAYIVAIDNGDNTMSIREVAAEELYDGHIVDLDAERKQRAITMLAAVSRGIDLARKERGPDPTEKEWSMFEKRPKQTWDADPVRNRRARKRQSKW